MPSGSPTAVLPGLTASTSASRLDQASLLHQAQAEAAASIAAASAGVLANGLSQSHVPTVTSPESTDTSPVYTSTAATSGVPTLSGSIRHAVNPDSGLNGGLAEAAIESKSFISTSAALNPASLLPSSYSSDFSAHAGLPTSLSWATGWPQQAYYKQ